MHVECAYVLDLACSRVFFRVGLSPLGGAPGYEIRPLLVSFVINDLEINFRPWKFIDDTIASNVRSFTKGQKMSHSSYSKQRHPKLTLRVCYANF